MTNGFAQAQRALPESTYSEGFLVNPDRPFVYLSFDHTGVGVQFSHDEPPTRIWLRLVNNCHLPIKIKTFGVSEGAVVGEVGLIHDVVEDRPVLTVTTGAATPGDAVEKNSSGKAPSGYQAEASSVTTIAPGKEISFSIPTNHIGDHWHIEIPIEFDLPKSHGHRDETIGGEPSIRIRYSEWDLPPTVQSSLSKGR